MIRPEYQRVARLKVYNQVSSSNSREIHDLAPVKAAYGVRRLWVINIKITVAAGRN
jgi:hypothetical protein